MGTGSLEILAPLQYLLDQLSELKEILLGVLAGDNSMLSSEGSLANSDMASNVAGSAVGSSMGVVGSDEEAVGSIPGDIGGLIDLYNNLKGGK